MPLTLVLGPANSAKAGEVLGAYTAAAADRDALLVVPTVRDAEHYDRELAAAGAVLGRALTFSGLVAELARRAGFEARRLTALQRERLLRATIRGLELPALGDSARATGFPAAAGELLGELAGERVAAPRFAAALRSWAGPDPARAGYAADLAAVALAYERGLERAGRLDRERFAWRALDTLRGAPGRWGATPVLFYGFDDLTTVQRDAIETLSRVCAAPVTVSLTHEPGRVALAARARAVEELRALADEVRELPARDEHYEAGARAALHHLERHLFEGAPAPVDPGEAVVLMEAGGERAEAELVAAEVLAGLRAGVPAEEIVVVCRSTARSGALLERVLRRLGVPVASARTVPLGHTALGRGLLALGRCAFAPDAGAGDLIAYLRTPGACPLEEADALAAQAARRGVTGAREALALLGRPLPELQELAGAADPAAALGAAARWLLAAPRRRTAGRFAPEELLDARAAAAVLSALDELAELGEAGGAGLAGGEVLELLAGLSVPAGGSAGGGSDAGEGGVLIAEPLAIRARRFRQVFVTGLCEGEFPAAGSGDPFLGEERRRELALASGLVLPVEEDALARERYLLYACVSRATERVVLSYRSSDEDGNLVSPSPFLDDVAELFVAQWRERRRHRRLADVVWDPAQAPTAREQRLALAAAPPSEIGSAGITRRLGEAALGHVRHREILSGGALESFASCPVKWLVERQLNPTELAPDPEPMVRGSFMHDVLERVLSELGGPVTVASLPRAEELLDGLVAAPPAALAPGRPAAVRAAILRGIEADLRRYLRHEAGDGCEWPPLALERRFGFDDDEDSLPALILGEGEEQVRVRGVIDRIDASAAGAGGRQAIVRDYKSGSVRGDRCGSRWSEEAQLQVGLYMLAVRRLLAMEPVAGFYQPLTGGVLRARGAYLAGTEVGNCAYSTDAFGPEELEALLGEIEARAVEVAARLRGGELTPSPETCGRDGCRHPGVCWGA